MPANPIVDLFTGVANAARTAQCQLDLTISNGRQWTYAIPKIEVKSRLGVRQIQGKPILWFGTNTEEDRLNTIGFRLLASPQPQSEALPEGGAITRVSAPSFLVPPLERESLVAEAMRELSHNGYRKDAASIGEAFRNGDEHTGLTFFRIDKHRVLLVRVGDSGDSIFLRDGRSSPIYSVIRSVDASDTKLSWSAFHDLFEMLREWQCQSLPLDQIPGLSSPAKFGNVDVQGLAASLWSAYAAAREAIAVRDDTAAFPCYFELRDVTAELSYTVLRNTGGRPDREDEPFIRSVAAIRIVDSDDVVEVEIGLKSPEYVLAGESRRAFLGLLNDYLSNDTEFWNGIAADYTSAYKGALADPQRRKEALVLLSYRGVRPKNQFLVIWTGVLDGEEREFAFRVKLDRRRLADAEIVLPLEDPVYPGSPIPADRDFTLAEVDYGARSGLAEFFRACWLWDLAGDWYGR
jgi:hypothetical protein